MKNMYKLKIDQGRITLPEEVCSHLDITDEEEITLLLGDNYAILMSNPVFGEELLKKL